MADNRPEARIRQRRRRLVAGEHVVRAALVGRLAVRERSDHSELVGDARQTGNRLAKYIPSLGLDRLHLSAILKRTVRLGIESFLVGNPAG